MTAETRDRKVRLGTLLALGSCGVIIAVGYHAVNRKLLSHGGWSLPALLTAGLCLTLLASVLFALNRERKGNGNPADDACLRHTLNLQGAVVLCLFVVSPEAACVFAALFLSRVRTFYSLKASVYLLALTILAFVASMSYYYGQEQGLLGIAIFTTLASGYYVFTLTHSHKAVREQQLKQQALALNRELLAARELLAYTSRQSERLRISRNIHDLLGHQLTGLILNLEVAGHLSEGEAQRKVQVSLGLAKSLLDDLRAAVDGLRQGASLEFNESLRQIIANVPQLRIRLSIEDGLLIGNAETAETLIRCIQEALTNVLRHAGASHCAIRLYRENSNVMLHISDNGSVRHDISPGNGLHGMTERIRALSGRLRWGENNGSFFLEAALPLTVI